MTCFVGSGMVVDLWVTVVRLIYCSAGFCGCARCRFGFSVLGAMWCDCVFWLVGLVCFLDGCDCFVGFAWFGFLVCSWFGLFPLGWFCALRCFLGVGC